MPEPASFALAAAAGYLLGGIPSARLIAGRRGVDPLAAGERNPGAANVWRLLGPRAGAAVLSMDVGKGALAGLAGLLLAGWWGACTGVVLAMAGHAWPPWSGFRGGRSVACLTGGGLVLAPVPFLAAVLIFAVAARPARLWRAAAVGLLAYPLLFALLVPDRWRLIGIGVAYLILALAWLRPRSRP